MNRAPSGLGEPSERDDPPQAGRGCTLARACYKSASLGRVAELADAPDSKSGVLWTYRFESGLGYQGLPLRRSAWATAASLTLTLTLTLSREPAGRSAAHREDYGWGWAGCLTKLPRRDVLLHQLLQL